MPATYTENGNTPNGSQLEFTYTFPILQTEDVKVSLNGVIQATSKYTVDDSSSPSKIIFNNSGITSDTQVSTGAPRTGVTVRVFRQTTVGKSTGDEDPKAVFSPGSSVRASDLNDNQEQALYALHELQEQEDDIGFEARYRVNPSNPNTSLDEGDLVFNTTDDLLKVYTGSAWKNVHPTDTQLNNINIVAGDMGVTHDLGPITEELENITTGNINTVASSIENVNRYANEYKIASSAPSSPDAGDLWYDTSINKLKYYSGSTWVQMAAGGILDEDTMATNSASVAPSQQSVKAYVDSLAWLDQSTKQDGSVIYWKNSSSKYFADNEQNIKIMDGGNF